MAFFGAIKIFDKLVNLTCLTLFLCPLLRKKIEFFIK
jgi:hypothetical protein